jgi:phosphatidylglycerophosphatase A
VGFPIASELDNIEAAEPLHALHDDRGCLAPVQLGIGRWSRWVAVAGGFGYVPVAPGTAGSLAGVLVFLVAIVVGAGLSPARFLTLYAVGIALLLLLGIRAAGRAEVDFGRRDDGRIVIDEVVGQLVGLAPVAILLAPMMPTDLPAIVAGDDVSVIFFEVVTGFVLFRLFDVWKPGAIRWAERRFEGGLGVMADDMVAGLYAALALVLLHLLVFGRFFSSPPTILSASMSMSMSGAT